MHLLVQNVGDWQGKAKVVTERFHLDLGEPEDRPWVMWDFTLLDPRGVRPRIAQNTCGGAEP
jgi:hypothetical protein